MIFFEGLLLTFFEGSHYNSDFESKFDIGLFLPSTRVDEIDVKSSVPRANLMQSHHFNQ